MTTITNACSFLVIKLIDIVDIKRNTKKSIFSNNKEIFIKDIREVARRDEGILL
jgi:hypothetical protein